MAHEVTNGGRDRNQLAHMAKLAKAATAEDELTAPADRGDYEGYEILALVLDALGDENALFVFQIGRVLTTASASVVQLIHGGVGSTVGLFWQVGSSATLGASTVFAGRILADQSVTLNTTAQIQCGRAIALHAAVTLDTNQIANNCTGAGGSLPGQQDLPEPSSLCLVALAIAAGSASTHWRKRPLCG